MKEKDYSNREIDRMFTEIKGLLVEIKEQTTKTNGRVNGIELWKEGLMGKIIAFSMMVGLAIDFALRYILAKDA